MSLSTGVIEVLRGGVVEARHAVHAVVADADGRVVAAVGDPDAGAFYRSAAKPLQALPLVEEGVVERFGINEDELALCCASHEGEPRHVAGARSILAKAGLDESALRCGPHLPFSEAEAHAVLRNGGEALPIHNNCSGKHAGMLALAVAMGWDPEGYHAPGHPVQERMMREIVRWSKVNEPDVATAVDGCGVVCFAVPLRAMAGSFARFAAAAADGRAPRRIVDAMTGNPFMVGGSGRACTAVMERTGAGAFVKLGAEGVYGAGVPDRGLGIAIKVADGARRAVEVALVHVLHRMDVLDTDDLEALARWARPQVRNTRGEVVGAVRPAFELVRA
jgi:L-asparaginase II